MGFSIDPEIVAENIEASLLPYPVIHLARMLRVKEKIVLLLPAAVDKITDAYPPLLRSPCQARGQP